MTVKIDRGFWSKVNKCRRALNDLEYFSKVNNTVIGLEIADMSSELFEGLVKVIGKIRKDDDAWKDHIWSDRFRPISKKLALYQEGIVGNRHVPFYGMRVYNRVPFEEALQRI